MPVDTETGDAFTPAPGSQEGNQLVVPYLFNGASFDRQYNNVQSVLLPSAARTTSPAIAVQANPNHRGVVLFLNVTAFTTALSLTLTLQAIEPVGGLATVNLLSGTAVTALGLYTYALFPGFPATAAAMGGFTLAQNGVLPRVWTASVTAGNANSATYSLAASLQL